MTKEGQDAALLWTGRWFLGVSLLAFGVQQFRYSGHVPDLGVVPDWAPAHGFCAWAAGTALLAAGVCILSGRFARRASFLLSWLFLAAAFLRFSTKFGGMASNVGDRTVFFELLACCGGCWMLDGILDRNMAGGRFAYTGLLIFAVCNFVFGIGHFQLAPYIASLIPHWIPGRLFLAWFTGFAFLAAALSMAARRWMRLSGMLLGLMYFSWVVLVHAPRVAHALHNGDEWNSGFVCLAMAGCALFAARLAGTEPHSGS